MLGSIIILYLASPLPELVDTREWNAYYHPTMLDLYDRLRVTPMPPRLEVLPSLPGKRVAQESWQLNRRHQLWLERRRQSNPDQDWSLWIDENERLAAYWRLVVNAQNPVYYTWARRMYLQELKQLMTDEGWFYRRVPPAIPLWRLRDVTR